MRSTDLETARQWRQKVFSERPWHKCAQQAGASTDYKPGEAGGFFVESDELPGRRAYLKPLKREPDKYRAAREKIASDLAHDLGLRVPPALLTVRSDHNSNEERHVAVSLVLYPQQWSWDQLRTCLASEDNRRPVQLAQEAMPTAAAGVLAFDTWLGQWDHGDHPHNIVFGYVSSNIEREHSFVFLDFAYSMGLDGRWDGDKYKKVERAAFPRLMLDAISSEELEKNVQRIESVSDDEITTIVHRIPEGHLSEQAKDLITGALCYRKTEMRGALTELLSGVATNKSGVEQ